MEQGDVLIQFQQQQKTKQNWELTFHTEDASRLAK